MEYTLAIGNRYDLWIAIVPMLVVVLGQSILIYRKAKNASTLVGLSSEDTKSAFKIGLISAIGPSFSYFISAIGLASIMGAPIAFQRVSIVASANAELHAAQYTAEAAGQALAATGMSMSLYDACLWVMALNGCGWLVICLLFNDKIGKLTDFVTRGDKKTMAIFSASAVLGTVCYLASQYLVGTESKSVDWGQCIAFVSAIVSCFVLDRISKKNKKLSTWTMGISMIIGMAAAQLYRLTTTG